jgi:hypothetical protein
MRHFQVLMLALLAAITFELGLVIIKFPTPTVQATAPSTYIPEDPHETLKRQLTDVTRRLGTIEQRLTSDSKRLLVTCIIAFTGMSRTSGQTDLAVKSCSAQGWSSELMNKYNNFDIPFGP